MTRVEDLERRLKDYQSRNAELRDFSLVEVDCGIVLTVNNRDQVFIPDSDDEASLLLSVKFLEPLLKS